jgi:hypothetical protein
MEGQVITPQSVTIPAGSSSADFTITAPPVNGTHWVLIQTRYGFSGGAQARLIEIQPGPPGPPVLLLMGASDTVSSGQSAARKVALVTPAPLQRWSRHLTTDNPAVVHLPPTVVVDAGNSTNSFTIGTSPVTVTAFAQVDASAGGVTKSWFLSVAPNPNAYRHLQSVSPSTRRASRAVRALRAPSPELAGAGAQSRHALDERPVARPPPIVSVPAGATTATFSGLHVSVSTTKSVLITAQFDLRHGSAQIDRHAGTAPRRRRRLVGELEPSARWSAATSQGTVWLTSAAPSGGAVVALSSSNTAASAGERERRGRGTSATSPSHQ